ncbi:MAG: hypothetical protein AAF827_14610 [Cyanobacteria bacterium P01_D01_bin.6]
METNTATRDDLKKYGLVAAGTAGTVALATQPAHAQDANITAMEDGIAALSNIAAAAAAIGIGTLVVMFGFRIWKRTMG